MKKLSKDGLLIYVVAGGAALLGAVLMQRDVARRTERPEEDRLRETYRVAAVARDLSAGAELTLDDIKFVEVRMSQVPRHVFEAGKLEEDSSKGAREQDRRGDAIRAMLAGRILQADLKRDDLLLATDFAGGEESSLGGVLRGNQRAVSVAVDRAAVMGGLLLPNDRVDVLAFYRNVVEVQGVRREAFDEAQVILEDVTVLAVGGRLSRMAEGSRGGGGDSTVVLGLDPDQALALSLVQRNAQLSLLLRSGEQAARGESYKTGVIYMKDVRDVLSELQ
jgi:Flp pilus assembly protein CpaB